MIRIQRSPEPSALSTVRAAKLAQARQALRGGQTVSFSEYGAVKPDLAKMQHNKCCYCEKHEEQAKYRDVDHFRPKAPYWWLAWTWENLLFACMDCNREYKRDRFPLDAGSQALAPEDPPPGQERPLVIDPCDPGTDPAAEIAFRRERHHGLERWVPLGKTARGRTTIEVCGLARPSLLDLYRVHVNHVVRPKLAAFEVAVERGEARDVVRAWQTLHRGLLAPARPFCALARDALEALVAPDLRERYKLSLELRRMPTP